jgi:hypothetical protein
LRPKLDVQRLLYSEALAYDRGSSWALCTGVPCSIDLITGAYVRLQPLLWTLLLLASLLGACGDDTVECGEGTERVRGRCVVDDDGGVAGSGGRAGSSGTGGSAGQSGLECGAGTEEVDGECVAIDGGNASEPALLPVGAACTANDECATGTCTETDTLPGGYCTILGCSADNPCPVGSTCYASPAGVRLCMAFCEGDVDCREGDDYNCQPLYTNGISICAPSCTITGACSSGTRCNEDNGLCEMTNCDPAAAESTCEDDETCWPDTRGLSQDGGLCLRLCDPADAAATCIATKEVCQPLAANPATTGFCAPPVCSATHECPAGAICANDVCQPPALCGEETPCADDLVCVGGRCMPECGITETGCPDMHPDLVCATVLETPACLPLGSFPGSSCRPNRDDACSRVAAGDASAPMVCRNDLCLVDCEIGSTELCQSISDSLVCATGIFDRPLCLPKGEFPGGPCGEGDTCAQDLEGNPDVDMVCLNDTCVIDCDESDAWPGFGDAMCQIVDSSLTCSETAGDVCVRACVEGDCDDGYSCLGAGEVPEDENACLPNGTFPGSACGASDFCAQDLGGVAAADMVCVGGTCVVACAGNDDALCDGVSTSLTCSSAVNLCVLECVAGQCLPGYSCFTTGGDNACLPDGSFPGSECSDVVGSECADNLGGNDAVDQRCVDDTCVVECPSDNDPLCAGVNAALTCSESAGDICVIGCAAGNCLPGFACLDPGGENACLPTGTFPGSPCRATVGNECDANVGGNEDADMVCAEGTCVVACPSNDDALCTEVSDSLTCSESAGNLCVLECVLGACPSGYSCLNPGAENACLPDGTFPGSACRATGQACDQDFGGDADVDMICVEDTCVVDCAAGGDTLCTEVSTSLTCSESASDICVVGCVLGACLPGYSCLDPGGENACLPDGSFPGSECRAEVGDECDLDLDGNAAADMICVEDTCVVDCSTGGDGLCSAVDPGLTCSETAEDICVFACDAGACPSGYSCFDPGPGNENACLPDGSFPGSACRAAATDQCDQDLNDDVDVDMECVSGTCAVSCATDDDALCADLDSSLTCSESASDICVIGCDGGDCPSGFSCLDEGGENACLPTGSFPGSECRATSDDECDENLNDNPAIDLVCVDNTCVVGCAGNDDPLCAAVDASLTCSESAGDLCVVSCATTACPTDYSCLTFNNEDACLPTGSFPSSPCRSTPGDACDQNLLENDDFDMECTVTNVCAVRCDADEGICQDFDPSWTCSGVAGDVCVIACVGGECPEGYFCFTAAGENSCFPE